MTLAHWILLIGGLMPYFLVAVAKSTKAYDNADPRNAGNFADPLRRRAHAAHQNSLEAFGFFAVGVLLATARGADGGTVDLLAGFWLAARLVYAWTYLTDKSTLRSLVWFLASFATIGIFLAALLR